MREIQSIKNSISSIYWHFGSFRYLFLLSGVLEWGRRDDKTFEKHELKNFHFLD